MATLRLTLSQLRLRALHLGLAGLLKVETLLPTAWGSWTRPHGTYENDAIQWPESLCNQVNILVKKNFFLSFAEFLGWAGRTNCHIHPNCQIDRCGFIDILCDTISWLKETWAVTTAVTVRSCRCWVGRCSRGHPVLDDPLAQSQCKPDFLLHLALTKCEDWARLAN